jgi:hypothetical protein
MSTESQTEKKIVAPINNLAQPVQAKVIALQAKVI